MIYAAMINASRAITINKSAAEVFSFLAKGENNKLWRPDVIEISLKAGKANHVGAEYFQRMSGPFGQKIAGDYKIIQYKPNELIEFVVTSGPARPTGKYTFVSENNATKLTFSLSLIPKGFSKLMSPIIQKQMLKEMENLQNLKQVLEK